MFKYAIKIFFLRNLLKGEKEDSPCIGGHFIMRQLEKRRGVQAVFWGPYLPGTLILSPFPNPVEPKSQDITKQKAGSWRGLEQTAHASFPSPWGGHN